jgi:hypothetical protein
MTPVDRAAMQAAIEWMRAESPARAQRINDKLEREGFEEAGASAAYAAQCTTLRLKPWQPPPMYAEPWADGPDDGTMGRKAAELLLLRLLAAGLSRYEPDPIGALARVGEREPAA